MRKLPILQYFRWLMLGASVVIGTLPLASRASELQATASRAVNALGLDLLRGAWTADTNALISPYSIQTALAMTYGGADGATRDEMAKVLHYPANELEVHLSFASLRQAIEDLIERSENTSRQRGQFGMKVDPIALTTANRLFGQSGYKFRETFLSLVRENYDAQFETVDFAHQAPLAEREINAWILKRTHERICGAVPEATLDEWSRLVLVNAIYLKAPWAEPFNAADTKPAPFHLNARETKTLPMMHRKHRWRYAKAARFTALELPYIDGQLVFLILLPEELDGLGALEAQVSAGAFADGLKWEIRDVTLSLPKFKLEPLTLALDKILQRLGMKMAFDIPLGSANFDRIAQPAPGERLFISHIFHKTFLSLDEQGTEAAAATLGIMPGGAPPPGAEMIIDHPFLFAIVHRPSSACLFLGHVVDPR